MTRSPYNTHEDCFLSISDNESHLLSSSAIVGIRIYFRWVLQQEVYWEGLA